MLELRYVTHGEVAETTGYAVLVPRGGVNREVLDSHFPFEGSFHYRLKTYDREGYYWQDVLTNEAAIPIDNSTETLEIQVLVLAAEASQESYSDYYSEVLQQVETLDAVPLRSVPSTAGGKEKSSTSAVNLLTITKGATSVWNTIVSTAANLHQTLTQSVPLTDEAEELLAELSDKLATPFDEANHTSLLVQLWSVLFPSAAFERTSPRWKEAGFQSNDPTKDLKQSNILHC